MSIKEKEALLYKLAFLKPPHSISLELRIRARIAHIDITEKKIFYALISQFAKKALGSNKIIFQILCII